MAESKEYRFTAVIKAAEIGKGGAFVEFPYDVSQEFGGKGRVKVVCDFEDIEYRGSLVRMGTDCHIIGMAKDIRKKLGKEIGDRVQVRIRPDVEERVVEIPSVLAVELKKKELDGMFRKLSFTKQKEIAKQITDAKTNETIEKRLMRIIAELSTLKK